MPEVLRGLWMARGEQKYDIMPFLSVEVCGGGVGEVVLVCVVCTYIHMCVCILLIHGMGAQVLWTSTTRACMERVCPANVYGLYAALCPEWI